jgi:transposase-like protein
VSRRSYSEETKAAVMAALLEGQSVSSVARRYEIPKGTVSKWKHSAGGVATQKGDGEPGAMGELLLDLLRSNIESLIAISRETKDPDWIKSQSASELATFFGVKHDKVIRMVEALDRSDAEGD